MEAVLESPQASLLQPAVRVYGLPMDVLPADLYIPPDALAVMLDAFEGPLDVLLYLIRKANINILDIPMVPLTQQYLDYIEHMQVHHLELAADYLVMAAMLIEIKSRMLLPKPSMGDGEEAGDPRAELVRRLLEYEQMKRAAFALQALPQAERDFFWVETWVEHARLVRHPEVSPTDLQEAWAAVVRQATLKRHHRISREELSVREHMGLILRRLQAESGYVAFSRLFDPELGVPSLVVHFLAMLELAREQLVRITQTASFQPIYICLSGFQTQDEQETHETGA